MATTLVDTNVLLDLVTEDPVWFDWSSVAVGRAAESGSLCLNPIVYAETSIHYDSIEELDQAFPPEDYERVQLPWDAMYLAGRVYLDYRRNSGTRASILPDFFIGAHAAIAGFDLLTRDPRRYRTYFPTVRVIAPG